MSATLSPIGINLAILGIAQVATEELLAAQLKIHTFEQLERNIRASVYWPDFCEAAKSDAVPPDWLPGALGSVVLNWARRAAP